MQKILPALFLLFYIQISAQLTSFPGAEGFGKFTKGGRGGTVMIVTNLNDNGPGSFRDAATTKGPRIIVFEVSGTIHLESKLVIAGDVTIEGQTAPGDGICIADHPVGLGGDNTIIRYMRFRMGDKNQRGGMVDGSGGDDAFGGTKRSHIMIDHCSMSWSTDEVCSIYAGDSTTLQWNIIAEPLNYSYHFETGDKDYEQHGFGGIWGGAHFSAHHNLFAHCNNRTPRWDGIRNVTVENADFRNNVIYNWGDNNVYAGEGGNYNIINNYYKPGPSTKEKNKNSIANPWKKEGHIPFGKWYITGNELEGNMEVLKNNWKYVTLQDGTEEDKKTVMQAAPFPTIPMTTETALVAYGSVLKSVGASFRRDTLDDRLLMDVMRGKGRFVDVQGGYPHGIAYDQTLKAWPTLKATPAPKDTDRDGMPDFWEKQRLLNPNDGRDAIGHEIDKYYTNIEMYANGLVQ
jgi:hypothetical protein